ncbi:CSS-motif domain-containing protein [Serratia ureilytica]
MLMTHLAASRYRYYRWLLAERWARLFCWYRCIPVTIKRSSIELSQHTLATRTVGKLNQLLTPAQLQAERSMDMLNQPCENVSSTLRFRAAQNQALRAMLLVKNGIIYCSSLFGARHYQLAAVMPTFVNSDARLALRPSLAVSKVCPRWCCGRHRPAIKPAACCTYSISNCCPTFYSSRRSLTFSAWC